MTVSNRPESLLGDLFSFFRQPNFFFSFPYYILLPKHDIENAEFFDEFALGFSKTFDQRKLFSDRSVFDSLQSKGRFLS